MLFLSALPQEVVAFAGALILMLTFWLLSQQKPNADSTKEKETPPPFKKKEEKYAHLSIIDAKINSTLDDIAKALRKRDLATAFKMFKDIEEYLDSREVGLIAELRLSFLEGKTGNHFYARVSVLIQELKRENPKP